MTNLRPVCLGAILLGVALLSAPCLASDVLPLVKTKTETYVNVTLISKTATHAFVQHSRGVANVKLVELDAATLSSLGILTSELEVVPAAGAADADIGFLVVGEGQKGRLSGISPAVGRLLATQGLALSRAVVVSVLGGFVLAFLLFSYCAMLICKKTGQKPGILVWLPVAQAVPLLRAAGMPVWWLVVMLVPVVNVVAHVFWCLNISKARGKGIVTAILLMLPGTNLAAFLYLAFSAGAGGTDEITSPLGKPLETEPLPA